MNVFRMAITAIIAGVVIYLAVGLLGPLLPPRTDLTRATEGILVEAQADIGHNAVLTLSVSKDQSLSARNFDAPTRSVAFACSSEDCCSYLENCKGLYATTAERMFILHDTKTTLTARCLSSEANIHACKLYIGKEPAQVIWERVQEPDTSTLNTNHTISFSGIIRNVGETPSESIRVSVDILGKVFNQGKEMETIITHAEQTIEGLNPNKNALVTLEISLSTPGNYRAVLSVEGTDAGKETKEFSISVTGETVSLCQVDITRPFDPSYDSFEDVCRIKRHCTGCAFSFECRDAWENYSPAQGDAYYDPNKGEPGFAYLTYPSENGIC